MASYETRLLFSESVPSNASSVNYTYVTVTFQFRRTDYSYYGYNYTGSAYWWITCDGQQTGNQYFNFNWSFNQNSWATVATRQFTIGHNGDGSKYLTASAGIYFGVAPNYLDCINWGFTCYKIPRYTSITGFSLTSVSQTSATFSWSTSDNCDIIHAHLNEAVGVEVWTGNASSGSFIFTGLAPGTTYRMKIGAHRADSGLWSNNDNLTFTTSPIATISNESLSLNIGNNLTLSFNNYTNNKSFLRLSVQNDDGTWVENVTTVTETIQAESYSWSLSSIATTLYGYCKTKNSMLFRIICGTTIGGVEYSNTYTGTMFVVNSNPTFSNCAYSNTDTTTKNLLGATYLVQSLGNMQIQISTSNKAVPRNSASIVKYRCNVTSGTTSHNIVEKAFSSTAQVNIDLGTYSTPGTYTASITAIDSRGNSSSAVTKTFTVLPYHRPAFNEFSIGRVNNFEKEVTLYIRSSYSRLMVGTTQKNSSFTIKYRYCESGGTMPTSYTTLTGLTSATSGDDTIVTVNKPSTSIFLSLDTSKSYDFEFVATDSLYPTSTTKSVSQGIPPLYIGDNGIVSVNRVPDFTSDALLQVGSDIVARKNGSDRRILDEIDTTNQTINIVNNNLSDSISKLNSDFSNIESNLENSHQLFFSSSTADPTITLSSLVEDMVYIFVANTYTALDNSSYNQEISCSLNGTHIGSNGDAYRLQSTFVGQCIKNDVVTIGSYKNGGNFSTFLTRIICIPV